MGYRLLIVDDEEWIRKGLLARLTYLKLEFDEIYEAGSGAEGLGVLEENSVDIIVTDIRMPDMDGLTFISRAKRWHPNIKFLILSGYAEFSYAKQAIRLGAEAYLLKPLSNEELKKAMEDVFLQLNEEERIRNAVHSGKRLQKEKEARQFEREFNLLLSGTASKFQEPERAKFQNTDCGKEPFSYPLLMKKCPWLENIQPGTTFYAATFRIETPDYEEKEGNRKKKRENLELARFIIKNVFMELPGTCQKAIASIPVDSAGLLAIFAASQAGFRAEAEAVYFKISAVLEEILSMPLSLGVSGPLKRPDGSGREEAAEALKQRMVCGQPGIYFYEDVAALEAVPAPGVQLHMLRYFMEKNDAEQIRSCIHEIVTEGAQGTHRAAYLNMVWVRILSMVLSVLHERNGENPLKVRALLGGFKEFDAMHTLTELEQKLIEVVLGSLAAERDDESRGADRIRMAAAYIRENYNAPISVNWLAERFGMSPNYFSTMFKKETGRSAGSYITAMRIEKAKEMLTQNDQSAGDIARETGYDDAQYFFRVFKRETGQTPIQYRSRVREEQSLHEK